MGSCGIPTFTCVLLLLVLGALYASAKVQVSDLPGITTQEQPRDPMKAISVWRTRIWRTPQRDMAVYGRGRKGRIADLPRFPPVMSPGKHGGVRVRGNQRPIVDNGFGENGCRRRGGRRRGGGRGGKTRNPFSKRQLKLTQKLTNATALFTENLLTLTLGRGRGRLKDFCQSPFNIHMALTLLTLGAKGSTQRQMNNVAGLKATRLRRGKAHKAYHTLLASLATIHPSVRLLNANGVYVKRGIPLELALKQNLDQFYQAKFSAYPMAPVPEVPINHWVSMATQNNIPMMLDKGSILPSTDMVVINAMALSAPWQNPFDDSLTRPHVFETLRRELMEVHMMESSSKFRYKSDQDMTIVEVPYLSPKGFKDTRLAMYVVLPDLSSSLKQVIDMLTGRNRTNPRGASSMDVLFQNLKPEVIKLRIPKFKVEPDVTDLSKVLRRMGMRRAFNSRKANFTGVSMAALLHVDKFLHKTIVNVDERGSYVKASSHVTAMTSSRPRVKASRRKPKLEVVVDRPFIFFIRDVQTRLTLVHGVYTGQDLARQNRRRN